MMSTDTLIKGEVNSTMYVSGIIQNTSNVPVSIDVKRLVNNMPVDWSSVFVWMYVILHPLIVRG